MELKAKWKAEYEKEVTHAIAARLNGNEGMARVCARRAAGIVIGEYLTHLGYSNLPYSFHDCLSLFCDLPDLNKKYKDIANHFLVKVNLDHRLPLEADLINEVIWLEKTLLSQNNE